MIHCTSFYGAQWLLRFLLLLLSVCTMPLPTRAQAGDSTKQHGFSGAPYVKYAPETGWVGGFVGIFHFYIDPDTTVHDIRPSDISGGAMYSQRHQFSAGVNTDEYFAHDKYHLLAGVHYQRYPLDFYGVGNSSPVNPIDHYTPVRKGGEFAFTKNLISSPNVEGLNVGIEGELRKDDVLESNPGGIVAIAGTTNNASVPGAHGGYSVGLGAVALFDTRDNKYSTHHGHYEDIEAIFYGRAFASDFTFSRCTIDARRFIPITEDQTFAMQAYAVLASGNVPFYEMAGLGGDSYLRGYYLLRFRDNDMGLVQAEYRFPLYWLFGGVVFAGAGEVADRLASVSFRGVHPSFGAGLRLLVVPLEHINARVDYAIGSDSREIYFSILEAF